MPKPCLKRWHRVENVYTKNLYIFDENGVNGPHMHVSMHPPPLERICGPLCQWTPPCKKKKHGLGHSHGGGVVCMYHYIFPWLGNYPNCTPQDTAR